MAHQDHTNQSSEVNTTDLHQLLSSYDAWPLQCNDLTEVLSAILHEHGIEHTCMAGIVILTGTDDGLPFHMWIDLPDGRRIDYRAQMWLGDRPEIPHGIFDPFQFPGLIYKGHPLPPAPFHPALFAVLVATEYSDEINQMKPYVERVLSGRERVSEYPPFPHQNSVLNAGMKCIGHMPCPLMSIGMISRIKKSRNWKRIYGFAQEDADTTNTQTILMNPGQLKCLS
jgi:hypothetical protein